MKKCRWAQLKCILLVGISSPLLAIAPVFGQVKSSTPTKVDPFKAAGAVFSADLVNSTFKELNPQTFAGPMINVKKCQSALSFKGPLDARLRSSDCAFLINHIIWESGDGRRTNYNEWSNEQKNRLNEIFQNLVSGKSLSLNCPRNLSRRFRGRPTYDDNNPNSWVSSDLFLTADEAFDMYAAKVAHVLYLEAERLVPWSVLGRPERELKELFASYRQHDVINHTVYPPETLPEGIQENRDFVSSYRTGYWPDTLNCDPRTGYRFLRGISSTSQRNFIGSTEIETLANLTEWFTENVGHFSNRGNTRADVAFMANLENRLLPDGYLIPSKNGCHSAAHLFYDLAKSVNIPILTVMVREFPIANDGTVPNIPGSSHAGLVYGWAGPNPLILYHVDSIYADQLAPFLPVGTDGRRLSAREATMRFFEANWVSPEVMLREGLELEVGFPDLTAQSSFFGAGREGYFQYSSQARIGNFLGTWPLRNIGNSARRYNLYYELCNEQMIFNFCSVGVYGFTNYESFFSFRTNFPEYNLHSSREFFERATACVNTMGGCDAARAYLTQWTSRRGNTVGIGVGAQEIPPTLSSPPPVLPH